MPYAAESRLFMATAKVNGTVDIPNESCTMCGAPVGDNGLWIIMPRPPSEDSNDADPYDTVLHLACARFIGANAKSLSRILAEEKNTDAK